MRLPDHTQRIALILTAIFLLAALTGTTAYGKTHKAVATWYTGQDLGTIGAGGKLKSGKDIALTNAWRKAKGIKYGDKVYVKWPKGFKKLSGWYRVRDTGCGYRNGRPTIDFYYRYRSDIPTKFKRAGVVKVKITRIKHKKQS
jgi:3D (Asp-Asp-Asp) domain-containing protein